MRSKQSNLTRNNARSVGDAHAARPQARSEVGGRTRSAQIGCCCCAEDTKDSTIESDKVCSHWRSRLAISSATAAKFRRCCLIDSRSVRLIPGVLGDETSTQVRIVFRQRTSGIPAVHATSRVPRHDGPRSACSTEITQEIQRWQRPTKFASEPKSVAAIWSLQSSIDEETRLKKPKRQRRTKNSSRHQGVLES